MIVGIKTEDREKLNLFYQKNNAADANRKLGCLSNLLYNHKNPTDRDYWYNKIEEISKRGENEKNYILGILEIKAISEPCKQLLE